MTRFLVAACFASIMGCVPGCVELGPPVPPGDGDGAVEERPVVSLSVSNPTPQVNEQVTLICSAISGGDGLTFGFQPSDGRLHVDARRGTAVFVVSESDVGVAVSFTCTATNDAGTSAPSNSWLVTPTSSQ